MVPKLILAVTGLLLPTLSSAQASAAGSREKLLMDFGWRFALGHATDALEGTPAPGGGRLHATIRVAIPPGVRKRSAFNGLAPAIVQSTRQPGDITLAGSSPGLTSGVLKPPITPSALRPAVPEN